MSASREKLIAVGKIRNSEAVKLAVVQMALSGKSYSEIAKELDVKRGVVSGIVYRARRALVASPAPIKAPANNPSRGYRAGSNSQKRVRLVAAAASIDWQPRPVHLTEAVDGQCRWPLWKADAPFSEKLVCGLPAKRGQSYCAHCYGLSYDKKFTSDIDRMLDLKRLPGRVSC